MEVVFIVVVNNGIERVMFLVVRLFFFSLKSFFCFFLVLFLWVLLFFEKNVFVIDMIKLVLNF